MNRTKQSIKNVSVGVIGQTISIVCQFVCRTVFIYVLSEKYLGLNGLLLNVLGMMSISELGFGTAMLYLMYKPIADNDEDKIRKYINLYKIVYRVIAIVILIIGLCIMPFLKYIIADSEYYEIKHINIIYLMYLFNSIMTYLFTYKQSIIEANQQSYINIFYQKIFLIIQNIIQITTLIIFKNFILYIAIQIVCNIICNISIARKSDKMFPYLKEDTKTLPDKKELKVVIKNTLAMSMHKLGGIVVYGTDNILMSAMVSLSAVGIYSNYIMIISTVKLFTDILMNSFSASIGNLSVCEDSNRVYKIYKSLFFMNFWVLSFCSIELICLISPFIKVWVGEKYVFNSSIVIAIIINFYVNGMRSVILKFRDALGIFWNDRYKPIFESIINIVASILIAKKFGLIGIILGTTISTLTTSFWVEPYVLFKYGFKISGKRYYKSYFSYTLIFLIAATIITKLSNMLPNTFLWIVIKAISIFIIYNTSIFLLFRKKEECQLLLSKLKYYKNKNIFSLVEKVKD